MTRMLLMLAEKYIKINRLKKVEEITQVLDLASYVSSSVKRDRATDDFMNTIIDMYDNEELVNLSVKIRKKVNKRIRGALNNEH